MLCLMALQAGPGLAQGADEPPALRALRQRLDARAAAPPATLTEPRTVDGALLPAGTVVRWTGASRTRVYDATLPGPAPVFGTMLTGGMYFDSFWIVRLAADADVDGWPCSASSNVSILPSGKVLTCVLAAEARRPGFVVPAGTRAYPNWANGTSDFQLPEGAALQAGPPGTVVEGASDVWCGADGLIERVEGPMGGSLEVRGVRFRPPLTWVYLQAASGQAAAGQAAAGQAPGRDVSASGTGVRGRLARAASRGGRQFPAGAEVVLTFADDRLLPAP